MKEPTPRAREGIAPRSPRESANRTVSRARRYNSSLSAKDLENSFVHLTNVAIQKKSDTYSEETGGGKWEIRSLKLHLMSRYGAAAVDALFRDIHMLILRSLHSVQQVMINDKHCFELYGYDVLFDDTFKPWLLEV